MNRREFLCTAGGATLATGAGAVAAQPALGAEADEEGGGEEVPDFGSYLSDANLYEDGQVSDERGQDEVTIDVGGGDGLAFDPPSVWVAPGTTITWEWTGDGGDHNVVPEEGPAGFEHADVEGESGYTYEYEVTEEDAGITMYKCEPHEGQGMKGGIAVGDDVPTVAAGGGGMKEPAEFGVDIHEHWVGVSVTLMMAVSLIFTFFTLKYGESPHTSGGD